MASINTPNMNLIVPTAGSEPGPTYALDINASLTILDGHNHSVGSGAQINPAGLNINSALTFNNNPATSLQYASLATQSASPGVLNSIYVKPGTEATPVADLWFTDGAGNNVQITSGGVVSATIANIPGESYGAGTFTWRQGAGSLVPANMDFGSIVIRPNVSSTTAGITIAPYAGISSAFTLVLPALPASQSFLGLDSAGNITTIAAYPLTASAIATNTITAAQIANNTITATQIANNTITATQISPSSNIQGTQLAALAGITPLQNDTLNTGFAASGSISGFSTSSTTFVNVTGAVATLGFFAAARPVIISFSNGAITTNGTSGTAEIRAYGSIRNVQIASFPISGNTNMPLSICNFSGIVGGLPDSYVTYRLNVLTSNGGSGLIGVTPGSFMQVVQV